MADDDALADLLRVGHEVFVSDGHGRAREVAEGRLVHAVDEVARVLKFDGEEERAGDVDALFHNAGVRPAEAERNDLVEGLRERRETRATVLRKVADNAEFKQKEKNRAFVLMQYFGYLRRNPNGGPDADFNGYNFWLKKLDDNGGDFIRAEMVKAFISSTEYRARFGHR